MTPLTHKLRALADDRSGAVMVYAALIIGALLGLTALAVDGAQLYTARSTLQAAADASALAGATQLPDATNTQNEAVRVAVLNMAPARFGTVLKVGDVELGVWDPNDRTFTAGGSTPNAVRVTTRRASVNSNALPLTLASLFGSSFSNVSAKAIVSKQAARNYCILALATSGKEGIRTNGAPKANLAGCSIMSNTSATCKGHDLNADYGDAHGSNSGCGVVTSSNVPVVNDPYASLAAAIPPDTTCGGGFPQEGKKGTGLPSSNQWKGPQSWVGTKTICGDLQLTGDASINTGANQVLVIRNGRLDTNGNTLTTGLGTGLTIIFAGDNGAYTHAPTGGGTLDITAPTSGPWSGMAIYQDPALTSGVDISAAGNSPTWDISGMVYLPHSSVTFSGAVNKSSNGGSCFGLVVDNVTINGTASILNHGGCLPSGLALPGDSGKPRLVS